MHTSKLFALCAMSAMITSAPAFAGVSGTPNVVQADDKQPSTEAVSRTLTALKADPVIDDVIYQAGDNADWSITAKANKDGFADHVCDVLKENGALRHQTIVRVIDTSVVVNTIQDFRRSDLVVHCADLPLNLQHVTIVKDYAK